MDTIMHDLFADAVRQLLTDHCTAARVRAVEAGGTEAAAAAGVLWRALDEAGFADALLPEADGGAGLALDAVYPVLELCGAYALPVPLAETMVARALLARAGVARPAGSITLATGRRDDGALSCDAVRAGMVADWVLATSDDQCWLLPVASAQRSVAGFCLDASLRWPAAELTAARAVPATVDVRLWQACLYAALTAGALLEVFDRTLRYANDRVQFGKPIGKFQAIQHQLSVMSEHAFAARMAARIGCQTDGAGDAVPERLRVALAKARASEAALEVAALAHSIHGAIGFTAEFDLQLLTRRLHLWRQAAGSESYWHDVVGATLVDGGGIALDLIRAATDPQPAAPV